MKKILVPLIVFGLLFAPITTVQAQDSVEIRMMGSYEVTVQAGDQVVLLSGWGACSDALVKLAIKAFNIEIWLNGEPLMTPDDNGPYWGPIELWYNPNNLTCVVPPNSEIVVSYWRYALEPLDPGTYEIHFVYSLDHPIIDGGDWDGDGKLDKYSGVRQDNIITLHVE